jgi:hypothetical protein
MARTALFSRLRRLVAVCRAAERRGIHDPHDIAALVHAPVSRRGFGKGVLAGAAIVGTGNASGCGDDGGAADTTTGDGSSGAHGSTGADTGGADPSAGEASGATTSRARWSR